MINSIVKTTVLFIFGLTMDEYEYYLKEKKTEVKKEKASSYFKKLENSKIADKSVNKTKKIINFYE